MLNQRYLAQPLALFYEETGKFVQSICTTAVKVILVSCEIAL